MAIYGPDSRRDLYAVNDFAALQNADTVVVFVHRDDLTENNDGSVRILSKPLGQVTVLEEPPLVPCPDQLAASFECKLFASNAGLFEVAAVYAGELGGTAGNPFNYVRRYNGFCSNVTQARANNSLPNPPNEVRARPALDFRPNGPGPVRTNFRNGVTVAF